MIENLRKISEQEMLRNWAIAEVASERRLRYVRRYLEKKIVQKVRSAKISEISDEEWKKLEMMIYENRAELLNGLLKLNIKWHKGRLSIDQLEKLEIMNWPPFVRLTKSRKLIDLVRELQKGNMPSRHHEFAENLKSIKRKFSAKKMIGMPIIVSKNKKPPYFLIEGFTRLSALLLNKLESKAQEKELPIILGISKNLGKWKFM